MERVLSSSDLSNWKESLRLTFEDFGLRIEGGETSKEAAERGMAVVHDVLKGNSPGTVLVTHGNLMARILHEFDTSFGFNEWASLTNHDVYRLTFASGKVHIARFWD